MKGNTDELTPRQRFALPIIAAEPTIDGAADKIGVNRKTVYEWLKRESFKHALEDARKEYVESGFRTLRLAAKRAAEKIVKHLDCTHERIGLRAAEDVVEFAKEFIGLEDHERRIKEQGSLGARTSGGRTKANCIWI